MAYIKYCGVKNLNGAHILISGDSANEISLELVGLVIDRKSMDAYDNSKIIKDDSLINIDKSPIF